MIVLFDMDDVIVEWRRTAIELAGHDAEKAFENWNRSQKSTARQIGMSDEVLWDLIRRHPNWWVDLPKTPWADELIEYVEQLGHEWYFCTSPPRAKADNRAPSQKMEWADKHGYDSQDKVVIAHNKWLLATPDKVLIDDKDSNCEEFINHGGEAITMPQPWNKAAEHIGDRLAYVKLRLALLVRM